MPAQGSGEELGEGLGLGSLHCVHTLEQQDVAEE